LAILLLWPSILRPSDAVIRVQSKHSTAGSSIAEITLWGAPKEWSVGLEMKHEDICPIPILWPATDIEGGLRYEIPLRAPCQRNQFKWTVRHPTGTLEEFSTILEGKSRNEIESSQFVPDAVSNVRQAGTQMLRWTRSPCADKYVVRVEGDPTQQFVTEENWIFLNSSCEEVRVVVEAHSGENRSPPSVSAPFNPCTSERGPDGDLTSWMKENLFISQREQRPPKCF